MYMGLQLIVYNPTNSTATSQMILRKKVASNTYSTRTKQAELVLIFHLITD